MRLIFTFLFALSIIISRAQNTGMNNALKMRLEQKTVPAALHTVLVKGNIPLLAAAQDQYNYQLNYFAGDIASLTCNLPLLALLIEKKIITYAEFIEPHNRPMSDTMLVKNRIKALKTTTPPLLQPYNGTGIIVGIIDTGLDFAHGDFKDAQGSSRIKFLWDQVPTSGPAVPAPFNYGIEWTDAQINAGQCTHDDLAHYGHGTHVAGIAAGNGRANNSHEGIASQADIIAVAVDFNRAGPTTADAVQYIFSKAALLNKPCVINASIGDYYGSHDGTNAEAKLIDNLLINMPGRVLVAAAGNGGNIKHHVKTQPALNDTLFTWLNSGGALNYWCYADTAQVSHLKMSVGANRGSYFYLGNIGFKNYNYALGAIKYDTLFNNGNRIGIVKSSASINPYGVYELYLRIDADTSNLLWRVETCGSGLHHAWNFNFVSAGLPTAAQYPAMPHYAVPDTLYSLVSSFQCSEQVITVANYVNTGTFYDVNNTLQNSGETTGQIAGTSSSGPTRDGRQKPDIAASGNNIFSSMALGMQANLVANLPQAVAPGSLHVQGGGTSASAPVVAGLAALYLERHPNATSVGVKNAIINCAYSDVFTGTSLPDYRWGYGKLDGFAAMTCGESDTRVHSINGAKATASYFPNPFRNTATIHSEQLTPGKISVYNMSGQLLFEDVMMQDDYELQGNRLPENYWGILFIKITARDANFAFKLIREN